MNCWNSIHLTAHNFAQLKKMKRMLKKNGEYSTDVDKMRLKWNKYAKQVSPEVVRNFIGSINQNNRNFIRNIEI